MAKRSDILRELEAEFAACPDPLNELRADWQYPVGSREVGSWGICGNTNNLLRIRFEALARRAGVSVCAGASGDPLVCWLELMRKRSINFQQGGHFWELTGDGGYGAEYISGSIERVCEASATLCFLLRQEAEVEELLSISTSQLRGGSSYEQTAPESVATDEPPNSTASRPAGCPELDRQERTAHRGPKPDFALAARVVEIVTRIAAGMQWRDKLDEICDALDENGVSRPKTWSKRGHGSWFDALVAERTIVVKAIEHHLDVDRRRQLTFG